MADDWVLDVLIDLSDFARRNEMSELVSELERTIEVARRELADRHRSAEPGADLSTDRLPDTWVTTGS